MIEACLAGDIIGDDDAAKSREEGGAGGVSDGPDKGAPGAF